MKARYDFPQSRLGLKDFQRQTVDYVFKRLYLDPKPVTRFLVADEVGLGKTLVAKGLIARAIERLQDTVERIDIVYVCSNADIARQNLARLNVTGRDDIPMPPRITLLPTRLRALNEPDPEGRAKVNLISFTPGTSFDLGNRGGLWEERVLLHNLLGRVWGKQAVSGTGSANLLRATATHGWFRKELKNFDGATVDPGLAEAFVNALRQHDSDLARSGKETVQERFASLRRRMARSHTTRRTDDAEQQFQLLGELRRLLATSCVSAVEPDLIILDEFQRFRHLLDSRNPAGELAHDLFDYADARVLLLSATPYKMYTVAEDIDDDHYADFLHTLKFLFRDDERRLARFRHELRAYRTALFDPDEPDLSALRRSRARLERELRRIMVRTERLADTPDRNGMLVPRLPETRLTADDVQSYVALDRIAREFEAGDMLEYWKSISYPVNFMEDYRLGEEIEAAADGRGAELRRLVQGVANIDWNAHMSYLPLVHPNARMRFLLDDVVDSGAWRLLWLAPSLPYYELGGVFADERAAHFTKKLVFSAWTASPRSIAALVSYEVERRIMRPGRARGPLNTPAGREKIKPLLRIARSRGRPTGMPVLALLYPSPTLARLADPLTLGGSRAAAADSVHAIARERVTTLLEPLLAGRSGPVDPRWYWAAPLLVDEAGGHGEWLGRWNVAGAWTGSSSHADSVALQAHIDVARTLLTGEPELGAAPDDLADVLALLALAGPANCALRALARGSSTASYEEEAFRDAAARVAWGLRSLFNQPEATYLVRKPKVAYWRRVLEYSFDGCLQAVIDEYAHVLREWLGVADRDPATIARHVATAMYDVLSLRRVAYGVREVATDGSAEMIGRRTMGGRFALRFGDDDRSDDGAEMRRSSVRAAFNSPFWPFVLATTSVGQEGLDFHLYCHAVVHWNLPTNPVDLEQREGRVHRYKGHAVRKNLAETLGPEALGPRARDPWSWMFREGAKRREKRATDIVPSWIYTENGTARIERIVPTLPLSRDRARLDALTRGLVAYRLAFGQPRQEELVAYLSERFDPERIKELQDELHIDLAPRRRARRATT